MTGNGSIVDNNASASETSNDSMKKIYMYKNDPKVSKKGVFISNFQHVEGGYLPILNDSNYNERKFDNKRYSYDDRLHHGKRPMHQTTFSLTHQPDLKTGTTKTHFLTHNSIVIGNKVNLSVK
jgi:hypothetical protein